jgi:hypothetical protein
MDVPGVDGIAIWRGTSGPAPNPMGHTGPSAKPYCAHNTNTDKGGHKPPKDQASDGPVPQEVQQLCQIPLKTKYKYWQNKLFLQIHYFVSNKHFIDMTW